ncbi:MAG: flagellar protein FlgN [Clostridiaceae bacterium]|nr:flagellar protein FlgN [Clostridiaceae bacterium]
MKEELNNIIVKESEALQELIDLLEAQVKFALEDKIMDLEAIVPKIETCNKKIAELEMARRGLTKGEPMSKIINTAKDIELEENYRKIKFLVEAAIVQKKFNMDQIKQGLHFTNRILSIINPDRGIKTYNAYGKIKK